MGAGAWGTALAKVLADAGNDVTLWARRPELADEINDTHRNATYLGRRRAARDRSVPPATPRPRSTARARCCSRCRRRPCATNLEQWRGVIGADATLVSVAKGIELDTLMRMSQVIVQVTGVDPTRVAVVTGPTSPARSSTSSRRPRSSPAPTRVARSTLQRAFSTGYFRPYTNSDVVGAEIGGACKNVIALACGMAAGVGLGENTAAAIITRGLAEIMRLGIALGAKGATLAGLAGVGDLVATCTSPRSRNRAFGERLGRGGTMESALRGGGRSRRRGRHVVPVGARAGVQLRRRDAAHRRGEPGLPPRACRSTRRWRCCSAAARSRSERHGRPVR